MSGRLIQENAPMASNSLRTLVGIAALVIISAGCSKDPAVEKQSKLKRGDAYAAQGKLDEAIIEYRGAIQLDPKLGEARRKLGDAYAKKGDQANAAREYIRGADLLPDDADLQLVAGASLLLAGQFEDARARVDKVLAKDPKNGRALLIRANALAGLKDTNSAIAQLEEAVKADPKASQAYSNLGTLLMSKGQKDEAEYSYRRAVEVAPTAVEPLLALGNFLWNSGRKPEAEQAFTHALELDPKNRLARRMLAVFYLGSGQAAEAESQFKWLADNGDALSRLALADFYGTVGRPDDARAVLQTVVADPTVYVAVRTRLATLAVSQGNRQDADKWLGEALAKEPNNVDALNTKAQFLVGDRKFDEALVAADAAAKADASSARAHYLRGTALAAGNHFDDAVAALNEAIRLNPKYVSAQLELAQVERARGERAAAVEASKQAVGSAPADPVARLILVRNLIANRELARAETELTALLKQYPNVGAVHAQMGLVQQAAHNDTAGARRSFERALQLDPKSTEALTGLVGLDLLVAKKPADAFARIDAALKAAPDDPDLLMLAGRTYTSTKDYAKAEASYRRVMEIAPQRLGAYTALGQLLVTQARVDDALKEFDAFLAQQPKSAGTLTLTGMLLRGQGKLVEAQQRYERAVEADPRAAVAANNLAGLYAESGSNLDAALKLAQNAVAEAPDEPAFNDTLGYVYLKKGMPILAVPPLKKCVQKAPTQPVVRYHLGLAYAGTGDKAAARRELEQALKLKADFPGAEDAKAVLAGLDKSPG
jgi:tetratricopeptide (TPR) repeat protein